MLVDPVLNGAMQMIERPWGASVYGAGSVRAVPDQVRIRFKVSHRREHDVPDSAVDSTSARPMTPSG